MVSKLLDYLIGWFCFALAIGSVIAVVQIILDFNNLDLVKILS